MATKGYALTAAEARAFNRMRGKVRRQGAPKARRTPRRRWAHSGGLRYAKLTEALDAATAFLDGATTATADLMYQDQSNPGELIAGNEITVTNRWVDLELASGKYLIVARVSGEWAIVASECP